MRMSERDCRPEEDVLSHGPARYTVPNVKPEISALNNTPTLNTHLLRPSHTPTPYVPNVSNISTPVTHRRSPLVPLCPLILLTFVVLLIIVNEMCCAYMLCVVCGVLFCVRLWVSELSLGFVLKNVPPLSSLTVTDHTMLHPTTQSLTHTCLASVS